MKPTEEPVEKREGNGFHEVMIRKLLGDVGGFLDDPTIDEILINGPYEVFVERAGKLYKTSAQFIDETALEALARGILQFSGKRLSARELSSEARLYDGSRVHIVQSPAARPGICIAIRKFKTNRMTLDYLVDDNVLSAEARSYLNAAMHLRKNIIISGGTGSGKTTLLNALSELIGLDERVIVIEDATELQLSRSLHVVQFEVVKPDTHGRGGADVRELFRASLRMRPDRVIVGECRSGEALDMVQAMNSGHSGSLSTVHANNPRDAMLRLETLCLMSDVDLPLSALRRQLSAAIDIVVQVGRYSGVRRVSQISEIAPSENGAYEVKDLFTIQSGRNGHSKLTWTSVQAGFAGDPLLFDFQGEGGPWIG